MKKYITYIYISLFPLSLGYAQEIKTEVIRTNSIIEVPSGQKIECLSAEGKYTYDTYLGNFSIHRGPRLKITKDTADFIYAVAPIGSDDYQAVFRGVTMIGGTAPPSSWVFSGDNSSLTIEGPVVISYHSSGYSNSEPILLSYKTYTTVSNNSISATSVVIPSTAAGDVDVKLEQSADNVTWTECLPGTYNSSTVKRFFRLRAVEK
jgi:hypothetical protein